MKFSSAFIRPPSPMPRLPLFVGSAFWFFLVCSFGGTVWAQTLTQTRDTGPRANRINVVFVAEGYTAAEQSKFASDAAHKLQFMLNDESWVRFSAFVNAFTL